MERLGLCTTLGNVLSASNGAFMARLASIMLAKIAPDAFSATSACLRVASMEIVAWERKGTQTEHKW